MSDAQVQFTGEENAAAPWVPPPDVILRSSDSVDFHCHKIALAFYSDVFDGLFDLAHGPGDAVVAGKKVVPLTESAEVLGGLLARVYPTTQMTWRLLADYKGVPRGSTTTQASLLPDSSDVELAGDISAAAGKYLMLNAETLLEELLLASPLLSTDATRVFVWGVGMGSRILAATAAYHTLNDAVPDQLPEDAAIHPIHPDALQTLVDFHASCADAARAATLATGASLHHEMIARPDVYPECLALDVRSGEEMRTDARDRGWGWTGEVLPPPWFRNHVARVAEGVAARPGRRTALPAATKVAPEESTMIQACPACAYAAEGDLRQYGVQLASLLDTLNNDEMLRFWGLT
ncbi:hypothetical protein FB451DRAFT_1307541 [Mycena latifolia]|nr:hypothetical protein FB451DRAFT_1307541 [Mycena latifolia]